MSPPHETCARLAQGFWHPFQGADVDLHRYRRSPLRFASTPGYFLSTLGVEMTTRRFYVGTNLILTFPGLPRTSLRYKLKCNRPLPLYSPVKEVNTIDDSLQSAFLNRKGNQNHEKDFPCLPDHFRGVKFCFCRHDLSSRWPHDSRDAARIR